MSGPRDTIPPSAPPTEPDIDVIPSGSAHERMSAAIIEAATAFQALCAMAHAMARALDAKPPEAP